MREFSAFEKRLMDMIQAGLPMTVAPFADMAAELGVDESLVLDTLKSLRQEGVVRRIGGVFDSKKMGYSSMLCACEVADDRIDEVAAAVNALPGVTHNYRRDHRLNLWFTLTALSGDEAESQLKTLEKDFHIEILRLPAIRVYKTRVAFSMEE